MKILLLLTYSLIFISSIYASESNSINELVIKCKNKNMSFTLQESNTSHILSYQIRKPLTSEFRAIATKLTGENKSYKSGTIIRKFDAPGRYIKNEKTIEALVWVKEQNVQFHTRKENSTILSESSIPVVFYGISQDDQSLELEIAFYKDAKIIEEFQSKNCQLY